MTRSKRCRSWLDTPGAVVAASHCCGTTRPSAPTASRATRIQARWSSSARRANPSLDRTLYHLHRWSLGIVSNIFGPTSQSSLVLINPRIENMWYCCRWKHIVNKQDSFPENITWYHIGLCSSPFVSSEAITYRDPTKSCLSHSFRFPRLWTQHQEVMPKSCLFGLPPLWTQASK